jgi:hypothetical protein
MKLKFNKYNEIGGIEFVYQQFFQGKMSPQQISGLINFSIETIRKDLKSYKGASNYKLSIYNRSKLRRTSIIRILKDGFESYDHLLAFMNENSDFFLPKRLKKIQELILIAKENLPKFNLVRVKSNSLIIETKKSICMMIGIINTKSSDYRKGVYRFKISSKEIQRYDYALFCVREKQERLFYIFDTSEISQLKSLGLKFRPPIDTGRYASNLNKWSLIKE